MFKERLTITFEVVISAGHIVLSVRILSVTTSKNYIHEKLGANYLNCIGTKICKISLTSSYLFACLLSICQLKMQLLLPTMVNVGARFALPP